jgi:hypothetical protein
MIGDNVPSGDNSLLVDTISIRKIGKLERFLGPENYRIIKGLLKTPASLFGLPQLSSLRSTQMPIEFRGTDIIQNPAHRDQIGLKMHQK